MIEAVIFDLDGTIIDSEETRKRTELEALREQGADLEADDLQAYTGIPLKEWFPMLKEDFALDIDPDEAVHRATELYLQNLEDVTVHDDAHETIAWVHDQVKTAIGTSSQRLVAEQVIEQIGIGEHIDTVVTSDDVPNGKPEPDIFEEAAHRLDVRPEHAVVIEDSSNGIEAANRGGFISIGYQDNPSIDLSDADHIVSSMSELRTVIEDLRDA